MDHAALVRGGERLRDLGAEIPRSSLRDRPPRDDRGEGFPVHQLHHEKFEPLGGFEVEDRADAGVAELGEGERLATDPFAILGGAPRGPKELERDVPIEPIVVGAIDLAHAAAAEPFHHAVP